MVIQIEAEWDSLFNLASEMALIPQPCSWQIAPPAKKYVPPLIRVFLVLTLTNLPRDHVIRQDMNFAHRTVRMLKGHLTPSSGDHFPWINWRRRCKALNFISKAWYGNSCACYLQGLISLAYAKKGNKSTWNTQVTGPSIFHLMWYTSRSRWSQVSTACSLF